jgi:hypothetical protein
MNKELGSLDAATLKQLRIAGADLAKPTEVINYLYFPKEANAKQAGQELIRAGYRTRSNPSDVTGDYLVVAEVELVLTPENVATLRRTMEDIAARFKGDYDGWEAAVTP